MLLKKNINCEVYESSKIAGGRCRSFYDKQIKQEIDNGNHLVFSANKNFLEFLSKQLDRFKLLN